MGNSAEKTQNDTREMSLHLVTRIFDVATARSEETKLFQSVSHEDACEAFRYWLEQIRIILAEPVDIAITQSLRDNGIDVLLTFLKSKVKFGFQIKSYNDVGEKDFTKSTIAQIERSRKHGVYRLFLAICADLTDNSQREKVRGLTSEISEMGDYCNVFSPEKSLRIVKVYQEKEHPVTLIEGMDQVIALLHAVQKKLGGDAHYTPEIKLTYKLKDRLDQKQHPIKFNLTLKYPKGKVTKTLWDILKEIQLTGESVTIPGENIEKFELFMERQKLIPEGTQLKYLTITPEKPKLPPVVLETIDPEEGSLITFENIIFVRDAIKGTTVHLSTHENNLPYTFRCSLDKEQTVGNFGFSVGDDADVGQRLKFERLVTALNEGQELILKTPEGETIFRAKLRQMDFKPLDEKWLRLLKDLTYIQERTAQSIYLPKSLESNDLYNVHYLCQLLREGRAEIQSLRFRIGFTKKNAEAFLNEMREKKMIKDFKVRVDPLKTDLFGKQILLGPGGYFIPELTTVERIEILEKAIKKLKENETIEIEVKNTSTCTITATLDSIKTKKGLSKTRAEKG